MNAENARTPVSEVFDKVYRYRKPDNINVEAISGIRRGSPCRDTHIEKMPYRRSKYDENRERSEEVSRFWEPDISDGIVNSGVLEGGFSSRV